LAVSERTSYFPVQNACSKERFKAR
jgi:hypothetical protein